MQIKTLSIKQPYVDLILNKIKTLEIRTWETKYRGRLYIHSCKNPFLNNMLCGYLLGYVDLIEIREMKPADAEQAHVEYLKNAFAWVLSNPVKIRPIKFKGQLGVFGTNLKEAVNLL